MLSAWHIKFNSFLCSLLLQWSLLNLILVLIRSLFGSIPSPWEPLESVVLRVRTAMLWLLKDVCHALQRLTDVWVLKLLPPVAAWPSTLRMEICCWTTPRISLMTTSCRNSSSWSVSWLSDHWQWLSDRFPWTTFASPLYRGHAQFEKFLVRSQNKTDEKRNSFILCPVVEVDTYRHMLCPNNSVFCKRWWCRTSCPGKLVDILGTNCDQCLSMVQCRFTSTKNRKAY